MRYDEAAESGPHPHQPLREPTSALWKILKALLMIVNVMVSIAIAILLLALLLIVTFGKNLNPNGEPTFPDLYLHYGVIVTLVTLNIIALLIKAISGFVGVFRPNLRALYIHTTIVVIGILWQIGLMALYGFSLWIIMPLGYFAMMYYLTRELSREYDMH